MIERVKCCRMVQKISESGGEIVTVLWVDPERRYLVKTTGTTLPVHTIYREWWIRVGNVSKKKMTEKNIPEVVEQYYEETP